MTPLAIRYMLVITSGPGSCSAPYHWATAAGGPVCGAKIHNSRWCYQRATPEALAQAEARGQELCRDCSFNHVSARDERHRAQRQADLDALARWNAAVQGGKP